MALVRATSEASADVRMKPGNPPNDAWPRLVKQTLLTDLTLRAPLEEDVDIFDLDRDEADSRNDRWHPSPQLMRVLEPSASEMRRDGDESRVDVVRIRMDVVIVQDSGPRNERMRVDLDPIVRNSVHQNSREVTGPRTFSEGYMVVPPSLGSPLFLLAG